MSVRRGHRAAAALTSAAALAAARILPPGRPIPLDLCPLHHFTGLPCPTCGLTRSVCLVVRGEWLSSVGMHPAGGLVAGGLVVAAIWLGLEAAAGRELGARGRLRLTRAGLALGAVLSGLTWGARLLGYWPLP